MNKQLVFDSNTGKARHIVRQEKIRRHKRHSHAQGECVEFIGGTSNTPKTSKSQKKDRGLGIIIAETDGMGKTYEENKKACENPPDHWGHSTKAQLEETLLNDERYTHVKVFWQNLVIEENVMKSHIRKIPDRIDGRVVLPKKK